MKSLASVFLFFITILFSSLHATENKSHVIKDPNTWELFLQECSNLLEKGVVFVKIQNKDIILTTSFAQTKWWLSLTGDVEELRFKKTTDDFDLYFVTLTEKGLVWNEKLFSKEKLDLFKKEINYPEKKDRICILIGIPPELKNKKVFDSWLFLTLLYDVSQSRIAYCRPAEKHSDAPEFRPERHFDAPLKPEKREESNTKSPVQKTETISS